MKWVVNVKTGQTGLIDENKLDTDGRTYAQFGPDGPFKWVPTEHLRSATQEEIDKVMGVT